MIEENLGHVIANIRIGRCNRKGRNVTNHHRGNGAACEAIYHWSIIDVFDGQREVLRISSSLSVSYNQLYCMTTHVVVRRRAAHCRGTVAMVCQCQPVRRACDP